MRVIAGALGGRNFATPRSSRTHPMSDKSRGALFNTLGDIDGLTFLDAFAGTGALSFEALSRGAASALMIEIDKPAQRAIVQSIDMLGLQKQTKLVSANSSGWSDNNLNMLFDIVIAAPPYDDLQLPIVQKLTRHVVEDGLFILDWPGKMEAPVITRQDSFSNVPVVMDIVEQKNYGDAQLVFYR